MSKGGTQKKKKSFGRKTGLGAIFAFLPCPDVTRDSGRDNAFHF